jgi:hypothetical protein
LISLIIFGKEYKLIIIIIIIKSYRIKWEGHVARMAATRNACKTLVEKPELKKPLGRPGPRWEDNIKMDLREQGGCLWTRLIWLRIGTGAGLL